MMMERSVDKELNEIYDAIDALMAAGTWTVLNDIFVFWESKAWRTDVTLLVGYATASFPGKSKIPARKAFVDKCMQLYPDPELWKGLE